MPSLADVAKTMNKSVEKFMKRVPNAQKKLLQAIEDETKRLELYSDGRIKSTVKNLSILNKIKQQLTEIIITPEYKKMVGDFVESFNAVTAQTNSYFRTLDKKFKPSSILKEIKKQAAQDTVAQLTETGLAATVVDEVTEVLRSNITAGGSYKNLTKQFRELLTDTQKNQGILNRYAGQIVNDAINQYSAQYNQNVFADLGAEWFDYAGTDILTTRPFCDAMTDRDIFHISEVPSLLKAEGLTYYNKKTKKREKVPLNSTTGLPGGMYPETTTANFFIRRGGYNCRHQIRPIFGDHRIPADIKARVFATPAYKNYKKLLAK